MYFPEDLRYAPNHECSRRDGDTIRIGISDFAQDALGDVVYVELPKPGMEIGAGEPYAEVESTKSVSDVYAPVGGTVVAVNNALDENPELVNTDPYGEGWFAEIEMTDASEFDALMDLAAYQQHIA